MEPTVIAAMITAGATVICAVVTAIVGPTVVDRIKRRLSDDTNAQGSHASEPNDVVDEPVDALVEAERRLEEIPLEYVPDPAPLPQGSVMPLSLNPLFVGREGKLKTLAASFKAGAPIARSAVPISAVTGPLGIGRTQLVSEFVHRYGQYFSGGVFWLSFADAKAISAEVAACGGAGAMELRQDFHTLPLDDQVRQVMSAWQSELPRLLVFANCEDEILLERWRPPMGGCRVLLTSRRKIWDRRLGVRIVELDVLNREESKALLRRHCPDLSEDDPALDAIADELHDLPLTLELAGAYLARYRHLVTPADYLARLRNPDFLKSHSLRNPKGIGPSKLERDLASTLAVSYDQLDAKDSIDVLALALLTRAALFAPGRIIPRELLVKALRLPEDPDAPLRVEDALVRLAELGMLQEQETGALRMHRLVAAFVQGMVIEKVKPGAREEAQKSVEEALTDTVRPLLEAGIPTPLLDLLPHLRVVSDAAKGRVDERAALLCDQLGTCLRMIGNYFEARPYLERALSIREKVLGEDQHDTATTLGHLVHDQAALSAMDRCA